MGVELWVDRLGRIRRFVAVVAVALALAAPLVVVTAGPAAVADATGAYRPVVPDRVLDTRLGVGVSVGRVGGGESLELEVLGRGGVPSSGVGAVALNVTAVEASVPTFVSVWPSGVGRPETSVLNPFPGSVASNFVVVPVGADGSVSLYNESGSVELLADVMGWFPGTPVPPDPSGTGGGDSAWDVPPLPDVVAEYFVVTALERQQGVLHVEDVLVIGLLWFQFHTAVVPLSAADAALERVRHQITSSYRIRGYRAFWLSVMNVDWERFPMTPDRLILMWDTYLTTKAAARQNALNHAISGLVASEEAWNSTMSDVRAWERQRLTQQQVSDAIVDGWRTIQQADAVIAAVDALL